MTESQHESNNTNITNLEEKRNQKVKPINYQKYFTTEDGKEAFVPKWLGDEIIEEYPLFYDGSHFYIYKNGVYVRDNASILGQIIVYKLDKKFRKTRLSETLT